MATIPTPGSELRHVRKTVTFTGAAGAGMVGVDVPVFTINERVIVERVTIYVKNSLSCATPSDTYFTLTVPSESQAYFGGSSNLDRCNTGQWLNASSSSGPAKISSSLPTDTADAISDNVVGRIFGFGSESDITDGQLIIDIWYRPITDDGALAGDDIDEDLKTNIWSKALSDIASVPAITASAKDALNWLFALARNKLTQTATTQTLKKDDGTTTVGTASVSDDGTTFTRDEWS